MSEKPKRTPRSQAEKLNKQKPSGEPKSDPVTGAPCPQDLVKGKFAPNGR